MNSSHIVIPSRQTISSSNDYSLKEVSPNLNSARGKLIQVNSIDKYLNLFGRHVIGIDRTITIVDANNIVFNKFLQKAVKYLEDNASKEILLQAKPYLVALNERTNNFVSMDLPAFSASLPEDGEALLEWRFENFTVGIAFDENPEDSSFYMVNDGSVKKTTAWGYLQSHSVDDLVKDFINEIIWNG